MLSGPFPVGQFGILIIQMIKSQSNASGKGKVVFLSVTVL